VVKQVELRRGAALEEKDDTFCRGTMMERCRDSLIGKTLLTHQVKCREASQAQSKVLEHLSSAHGGGVRLCGKHGVDRWAFFRGCPRVILSCHQLGFTYAGSGGWAYLL
ncbi:MAG: hypothetical protein VX757_02430, partial [Planctomycetota bacterium]|nr:hypothetical protein [Planctomycetota bacterium]